MLKHYTLRLPTVTRVLSLTATEPLTPTLYCAVPFIATCVDVNRTVYLGPFTQLNPN